MNTTAQAPAEKPSPWLARQPILTREEKVVGYELLFRETAEDTHFNSDVETATTSTIDTLNVLGLDAVCDGRLAFINCTRQMLLKDYFLLLPPDKIVIEIQETVPADEIVLFACQRLRQKRYRLALDNFFPEIPGKLSYPTRNSSKSTSGNFLPRRTRTSLRHTRGRISPVVAQKVEDRLQMLTAAKDGFTLFQGYFFRRPEHMRARHIPANQADHCACCKQFQDRSGLRRRRRPHQAQCVAVLSPIALSEFTVARAVIARSIDPPRHLSFGRARTGSLDSHGDNPRDGSGKMHGSCLVRPLSAPIFASSLLPRWSTGIPTSSSWECFP